MIIKKMCRGKKMINKIKSKIKKFKFDNVGNKINFVLILFVVILLSCLVFRNEQNITAAVGDTTINELAYYNVFIAGELATSYEISAIIMGGVDWREPDGKPISITFKNVEKEELCEGLVNEALASCVE